MEISKYCIYCNIITMIDSSLGQLVQLLDALNYKHVERKMGIHGISDQFFVICVLNLQSK